MRATVAAAMLPPIGLALGLAGAAAHLAATPSPCAAASYAHHATLVVEHGDARVIGLCIGFDGASITGEQLLQASGLEYATATYGSLGEAVCQIDSEPASYPPGCWTSTSPYWAMFVSRSGGGWRPADHGVSSETFGDGDAEGFRYDSQSGAEPPPASPGGICAAALAAATPAPRATAIPPTAGGGAGAASAAGSSAAAPTSAAAVSTATPAPAVLGPVQRNAAASVGAAASGPDAALLVASAAGGGLAGLAGVAVVRRRRRT